MLEIIICSAYNRNNKIGIVSTSNDELKKNIDLIKNNEIDYNVLTKSVTGYLRKERDIKVIQKSIFERLTKLVDNNESSTN